MLDSLSCEYNDVDSIGEKVMKNIIKIIVCFCVFITTLAYADVSLDPLPSWNAGPVKQSIVDFVARVTNKANADYVPPMDRIATFDNDGTLWVEQPMYPQVLFMMDRINKLAIEHPEWKYKQPYKALLAGKKDLTGPDIDVLFATTSANISIEDYQYISKKWFATTLNPRYQRHYNELIFQPMLEVVNYLRANQFKVYIVSGGGQDFIRSFAYEAYGVTSEQVVGATGDTSYIYKDSHKPDLIKQPKLLFDCNSEGKPEAIHLFIGKKPLIAFGNSDGDRQMLEWTQSGKGKRLMLLIHHDDAEREYAYDAHSKVGKFSNALMRAAKANHWQVISMKHDWRVLFPFNMQSNRDVL